MKKDFDSEPVYGASDNYIKMEIKSHGDKVKRKFHSKKIPEIQIKKMHHANVCL